MRQFKPRNSSMSLTRVGLLLEYIGVHELFHSEHRTHSRRFGEAVEAAMPGYRLDRARLKEVGATLAL